MTARRLSRVCVYAGSAPGRNPAFEAAARQLGRLLAADGMTIVYGGGSVGLMGALADAALSAGGTVIGVIPRGLFRREVAHLQLSQLIEVGSMHERKQTMFERADAFIALPGGLGTLEELTEMATWAQLGIHAKPLATVDVDGYWRPFHALLRAAVEEGFVTPDNLKLIVNVESVEDVLPALRAYDTVQGDRWLDLEQT